MAKARPSLVKRTREAALRQKRQDKVERRKIRKEAAGQEDASGELNELGETPEGVTIEPATPPIGSDLGLKN
jgi:hypothetical protein